MFNIIKVFLIFPCYNLVLLHSVKNFVFNLNIYLTLCIILTDHLHYIKLILYFKVFFYIDNSACQSILVSLKNYS